LKDSSAISFREFGPRPSHGLVCLPVLGRMKKEKENLQVELKGSHMQISKLRREIERHKMEQKRLRQDIRQADMDISRQKKDIDNAMNERDILGTQLVRRNDELSLQYSRIKVSRDRNLRLPSARIVRIRC